MTVDPPKQMAALVVLFVLLAGAVWGMVTVHAGTPAHWGALTTAEFSQFEKHVEGSLERIEGKLDAALER